MWAYTPSVKGDVACTPVARAARSRDHVNVALRDLSDPQAVVEALDEFDRIGRDSFLKEYGFGRAHRYFVRRDARLYDSKAIAAAAHGFQFDRPLRNYELYGGLASAVPKLEDLGFEVVEGDVTPAGPDDLVVGQEYLWEELGAGFDFRVGWLNRMGGMGSRPAFDAVLIITHPGGAKSFDSDDYWEDGDLIYTGQGQIGDQSRTLREPVRRGQPPDPVRLRAVRP